MGAPANSVWLPLLLMAIMMALAPLAIAQKNETAKSSSSSKLESSSPSTSTTISTSTDADLLVGGDLSKAARVEELARELDPSLTQRADAVTPKSADGSPYDVIDVLAATSAGGGRPKSGQTTRIYTTGEVNDDFWLKHLGDDFKHAIHLQVGGSNDDYNRIINQTSNGVHEEVHHEYLPGAERPTEAEQQEQQQHEQQLQQHRDRDRGAGYGQRNLVSQLSLDGEAMALKDNYLRQQEQQQQRYAHGYAQQNTRYNTHNTHNTHNRHRGMHHGQRHTYPHTHNTQQQHQQQHQQQQHNTQTRVGKSRNQGLRNRYKPNNNGNPASSPGVINSSEDTLHASQSQSAPTSALTSSSGGDLDSQLPFKSPFNDFGNRPTRDLTYLLYKRGL